MQEDGSFWGLIVAHLMSQEDVLYIEILYTYCVQLT